MEELVTSRFAYNIATNALFHVNLLNTNVIIKIFHYCSLLKVITLPFMCTGMWDVLVKVILHIFYDARARCHWHASNIDTHS